MRQGVHCAGTLPTAATRAHTQQAGKQAGGQAGRWAGGRRKHLLLLEQLRNEADVAQQPLLGHTVSNVALLAAHALERLRAVAGPGGGGACAR